MTAFVPRSRGAPFDQRLRRIDRNEVLARTDLEALADQLLGERRGRGRSAKWPSPVPGHPQTGASPPMSVFRTRNGEQRWKCFATGESGTAIDLVMVVRGCSFRDALEHLADQVGTRSLEEPLFRKGATGGAREAPPPRQRVDPKVRAYVNTCRSWLRRPEGRAALAWLCEHRGLDLEVLQANQVGFDPGPAGFRRPRGLPWLGPAVVFPILDEDTRRPVYFQARYLDPIAAGRKFHSPSGALALNPRVALLRSPVRAGDAAVVVTEGIPDGLAALTAGHRAVAVLGAAAVGPAVIQRLARLDAPLHVAFDRDPAGRAAGDRLIESLRLEGVDTQDAWTSGVLADPSPGRLAVPAGDAVDLNDALIAVARSRPHHQDSGRGLG